MPEQNHTHAGDPVAAKRPETQNSVLVWDRPLRVWHWALAVLVLVAWFTPTISDRLHRFSGYAVIALLVFRLAWGFLGTRYSRFKRLLPQLRAMPSFLWRLRQGKTGRYLGLNPAGAGMLVALLLALGISTVTGVMAITVTFFGIWWVEDTHAYASDAVMVLVIVHVLGTILMSVLQRENLPRAMMTGRKRRHAWRRTNPPV